MLHNTAHYQYHKIVQAILQITTKKKEEQKAEEEKIPWRLNPDQELALQLQANFAPDSNTSSQQPAANNRDIHQLQQHITKELKDRATPTIAQHQQEKAKKEWLTEE
eukprot:12268986-Prorocentrum_lima.AAC.1